MIYGVVFFGSETTINTETYYLYNTESNKCVNSSSILDSPITMTVCDCKCGDAGTTFYHDGNYIKSPISSDKYIEPIDN
ncbi:hypothetical protein PIROE2DRAFT_6698 [Piromyces sp. E2]|nr:hypothetical protein PIROE2DRAFT_6698 [Piromyces sp. E2]|eukprot:OUM66169.1 hypothetical protein PIROE2DRAFT_6698 [Piromyces sp. E2]